MKGSLVITRREFYAYLDSAPAYIFIIAFLLSLSIFFFFSGGFFAVGQASMRAYFSIMPVILSIFAPALTMRLWAEERRQGSYEILMTLPFSEVELVSGKFLASFFIVLIALFLSLAVPLCVSMFGAFDIGIIFTEYLGAILMAAAVLGIGQAVSGASKNQISAFLISVSIMLALTLMPQMVIWLNPPTFISGIINWLSLSFHFDSFARGIIDSRDLAYFLILCFGSLYLSVYFLTRRKWS